MVQGQGNGPRDGFRDGACPSGRRHLHDLLALLRQAWRQGRCLPLRRLRRGADVHRPHHVHRVLLHGQEAGQPDRRGRGEGRSVQGQRHRQDPVRRRILARRPAVRALLFRHLPVPEVSKEDTRVPGGIQFEHGERPKEQVTASHEAIKLNRIREKEEIQIQAQDILERINDGEFIAWREIPVDIQMKPGFLQAYNKATRDMVGPEREDLKIITIIGPPGCGKSYAISKLFPKAGRWLKGNNGHWFCNTKSDVMVFEEFSGQIELQSMLKYLDPYPLALEVKGGTEPAMYRLCIITSNTHPKDWYTTADEYRHKPDEAQPTTAKIRRTDALAALWDRLGYKRISRECGSLYYFNIDETEQLFPLKQQIDQIRHEIWNILEKAKDDMSKKPDPEPEQQQKDPMDMDDVIDHDKLMALADHDPVPEHEELPDIPNQVNAGLSDMDDDDYINPHDTQEI